MNNKDKKLPPWKILGNNFGIIISVLFALQIANFATAYMFKASSLTATLILFFVFFITFGTLKDLTDEKNKKVGFIMFKISILIFIFSLINHFVLSIANGFGDIGKRDAFFRFSYFLNFAVLIGSFAIFKKEEFKEAMQNIYDTNVLAKFNIGETEEKKPGNVQLCINKDTKKPVILPLKDRFLHLLVLGATGTGKTSQILIPMINQDMQNHECGITVIEPKGDLAEKVYAMAEHYGRKAVYFNPILPDCPYFNPLYGREEDVIENMATTFKMLNPDSPQFFQDMNENLIRNALKVLKRLMGNKATMVELARLIQNSGGVGRKMVTQFSRLNADTEAIAKENADIASWFLNDYFNEKSKTYEHCSGIRSQVAKIISNPYLRRVLNPPDGENDIDFDKHLADGGIIAISTAQGALRDLGRYLGYFIILQFQSAVFKRPGNENTRRSHFLYIDEFQTYSNPGFADMLTQGRSYRVASHLATQNRALMAMGGGRDGKNFVELVSTNARNIVIFPGANADDAKYYSDQFGEIVKKKVQKGVSRAKFNPLYGFQRLSYPNISERISEETEARFSPSDIIYRPFGEITYCIIQNNTVQTPGIGKVQWIPRELNDKLDKMIEEYNESIFSKEPNDNEDNNENTNTTVTEDDSLPVIKDPIATVKINNPNTPLANNVIKKPKIAQPQTIDDLPEEDEDELIVVSPKTTNTKENNTKGNTIINDFDFMSDEEDDLI